MSPFSRLFHQSLRIAKPSKLASFGQGLGLGLALCLCACSTTSHIPEDDQLFTGLKKIVYTEYEKNEHAEQTKVEVEAALATQPNGALFGSSYYRTPIQYRLWIWNATYGSKDPLLKWINTTFGKPPVLMSQVNPALRAQVAKQVLRTNGYLHGDVSFREVGVRNPLKAKIAYTVHMDTLFRVDTLSYVNFPPHMQQLIDSTLQESDISAGSPLSATKLDEERSRLGRLFRNNGYYYYQPSYASFLADTFQVRNRAKMRLQMADSLPAEALQPWYIGKLNMRVRRSMREQTDTTTGRRFTTMSFHGDHPPVSPALLMRNMKLRYRHLYSYDNYMETMQKLSATGVFSSVDLQFTPRDRDSLDIMLDCVLEKPYDFYVETNFVNRTIGRLGPELKVGLTRRNAFRGGEKIDINLHGSYEWETGSKGSNMNSYQYGSDFSIEFPRIMIPTFKSVMSLFTADDTFRRRRRPNRRRRNFYTTASTVAKVSSDVVRRPSYYKMHIVSGEWTYKWQPSETSRHELSPLTVKYQFTNSHTARYDSLLYENSYLESTMSDLFVPKMRYTYTYKSPITLRSPIRWETTVEESGNVTALYDVLVQGNGWNQKNKTLFKNPYSQFLKIETDLTKTWTLGQHTQLVGHLNYGLMWNYGNSDSGPFSELFYVGGANSIRAFPVRSIGPGGFPGFEGERQLSYLLQNGDLKLVMNLELRHRLFGNLYGAVFLDAGNVWNSTDMTVSEDDFDAPPSDEDMFIMFLWNELFSNNKFKAKNLFKQLATGTGIGLRYDLDFLVLRVDWGLGLHLPYETDRDGYFNIRRFKDMHTLHIAIGYPF
jgi:outer membrane protein assembly factor BamA